MAHTAQLCMTGVLGFERSSGSASWHDSLFQLEMWAVVVLCTNGVKAYP